jgi:DNA polymerase-3 subunit delta'
MASTTDHAYEWIASAHRRGRLAHAFLVSGARGSGKERLAARVVRMLDTTTTSDAGNDLFGEPAVASPMDDAPPLDELMGEWVRILRPVKKSRIIGVDDIRELEHALHLAAPRGVFKVGVIVAADRMNESASNAFLKTLEEPPPDTVLMLLTEHVQRLLPTIRSRCVQVPLTGGSPLLDDGGAELVSALNHAAQRGFGTPVAAMHLKAVFSGFLVRAKDAADAVAKAAEKEEIAAYKDSTDGAWLKEREDHHKAAAHAEYLQARSRLLDVLMSWMADLLRVRVGAGGLDFAGSASIFAAIAEQESPERLIQRIRALESLRRTLETNAFEPLAIEVAFLRAFG